MVGFHRNPRRACAARSRVPSWVTCGRVTAQVVGGFGVAGSGYM